MFVGGDRHWAELSRLDRAGDYPLDDLTSSALTETHQRGSPAPNQHDTSVGLTTIDWLARKLAVLLQRFDVNGKVRIEQRITF